MHTPHLVFLARLVGNKMSMHPPRFQAQLRALAFAAINGQSIKAPKASWMAHPHASLALGLVHDFLIAAHCNSTAHVLSAECQPLKAPTRHDAAHSLVRVGVG